MAGKAKPSKKIGRNKRNGENTKQFARTLANKLKRINRERAKQNLPPLTSLPVKGVE